MAKMCPLDGCKAKKGLCIHDKLMIAMGVIGMLGVAAYVGTHFFL